VSIHLYLLKIVLFLTAGCVYEDIFSATIRPLYHMKTKCYYIMHEGLYILFLFWICVLRDKFIWLQTMLHRGCSLISVATRTRVGVFCLSLVARKYFTRCNNVDYNFLTPCCDSRLRSLSKIPDFLFVLKPASLRKNCYDLSRVSIYGLPFSRYHK
jgi:hypothetical protein